MVECTHCGLLFVSPRPPAETIQSWYGPRYFSAEEPGALRGYSDYFSEESIDRLLTEARSKLSIVTHYCDLRNKDVLEIGCATGETCHVASQFGAHVAGCDLSAAVIGIAQSRYPTLEFHTTPADSIPFPPQSFDLILAFELIEHLPKPSLFNDEVLRLLRPGGILVLTTPNADCGRRLGWDRWAGLSTSFEHLYFFNSSSIEQMLSQRGMLVTRVYSQGNGRTRRSRFIWLKRVLANLHLLTVLKAAYQALFPPSTKGWVCGDEHHSLLIIAKSN